MNLRRLETYYWAVRLGSFKAAADKMNSTQSTVSMRMQELERELGVALFDRAQGSARPTELGRDLLPYVEKILRSAAEMRNRISESGSVAGRVRIGVAEVISMTWLPLLVGELRTRFPHVKVELEEALTRDLESKLDAGLLDVVLAPGGDGNSRHLVRSLGMVEFAWMACPRLCPANEALSPSDLLELPIIALSEESFHTITIEEWFASAGTPEYVGVCKSMGVAASLAMSGIGITLLPVNCFKQALKDSRLVRLSTSEIFPMIPFRAMASRSGIADLPKKVADIAAEVSQFHTSNLEFTSDPA